MRGILFDIGANTGQYADVNAKKYDKVILVEANPALCKILRAKFRHPKYVIENVLVSKDSSAEFYVSSTANTISTAAVRWVTDSRFTEHQKWGRSPDPIPCMSLDALIAKHGTPAYIKIDVEGYEYNVLQSLTGVVAASPENPNPIPLAFEWAEEMLDEIILSVRYLVNQLRYTKFALQAEDAYEFEPVPESYMSAEALIAHLEQTLNPARKELWGMIHCQG